MPLPAGRLYFDVSRPKLSLPPSSPEDFLCLSFVTLRLEVCFSFPPGFSSWVDLAFAFQVPISGFLLLASAASVPLRFRGFGFWFAFWFRLRRAAFQRSWACVLVAAPSRCVNSRLNRCCIFRLGRFFCLPRHFQFALPLRRFFLNVFFAEELAEIVLEFIEIHIIDRRDIERKGLREYQASDYG